ncbi:hypothetical protein EN836_16790 [Mesorhizobium sp. M1C.F.Ca.ET.193.01.1.1]|uniref:hypothetical protein n=1 Tax=unclassified Mesorhizobium TaxID=325217 RepID=UPI000FD4E3F2|nr:MULTISPECIES: hypothetical protein [unclassified Mesorhizobium]TGS99021.1 hypothetical protein EN820_35520 [bacterium M00.F.Ca.ET.177.01.1.1]TGQ53061.1 hypothetical protein EN853_16785 [Mesorhizobium sp. M1C.F.Ca.ET.210.01.1.1]TGQ70339.1 hypothetical protein EN855_016795 [Mesorhizobium sp. M1C.F.Ca.ET.212.01.1.1]TGR06669.1 hypothetical protein EN847_16790 [Mesorhizobium sp. M1C.F.Ca.ET.204.01.1.1]TGR27192.1 hypothetical protein EN839_16790 [Mesorhizobium sp. M1C.F.Ca.ET.196.01.1.1]
MLLGLIAVGAIGVLLGLRVRAPALIVATAVIVVVATIAGGIGGLFDWHRLLSILLLVVALQLAYLFGLLLGVMWRRSMPPQQ